MTSPAQLKYLDAMGIPVWVSQDLVLLEESIDESKDEATNTITDNFAHKENNHAKTIIDSLDEVPVSTSKQTDVEIEIQTELSSAVVKSKIAEENISKKSPVTSDKNLIVQTENHLIYACGKLNADWMVIGHSPESYTGIGEEPFVGEAGQLLDNMLRAVGIENPRQEAYLINILNRDNTNKTTTKEPNTKNENLKTNLLKIIEKNKPKLLLLVGQNSAQTILESQEPLIVLRNKQYKVTENEIPCVVTYYPSYLLQKPIDKRKAWDDLKLAMSLIKS